jgi:hypothetical protein
MKGHGVMALKQPGKRTIVLRRIENRSSTQRCEVFMPASLARRRPRFSGEARDAG